MAPEQSSLAEHPSGAVPAEPVRRVGLVLGAGGATGRGFHIGVLAALQDLTGFDARTASVIVGTSSGAPIIGLVRAGMSGHDLPTPRALVQDRVRSGVQLPPPTHRP